MALEIVWTAGAESDLLRLYDLLGDRDLAIKALREPLDHALGLLSENPALGPQVRGTQRVRRLLTGPRLRFDIFYVEEARRLMMHALVDMRQNPELLRLRLSGL